MPEQLRHQEAARRSPDQVIEDLATHFENVGHSLDLESLYRLVDEVSLTDLSESAWAKQFGKTPLAEIDNGKIRLDRRFETLPAERQRYILAHEYGHVLSWLLERDPQNEAFHRVSDRVRQLTDEHVSSNVVFMRQSLEPSKQTDAFMHDEKMAETVAQYLLSDRTFSGFVMTQLLEYDVGDDPETELRSMRGEAEEIQDLAAYLDLTTSDAERDEFLSYHPDLRERYELWQELGVLFNEFNLDVVLANSQTYEEADEEDTQSNTTWENERLAATLRPELPSPDQQPRTGLTPESGDIVPPPPFANLLAFWRLYP